MIVHIVMYKFKPEGKADNIAKAVAMLNALLDEITPLLSMEVGVDFSASERAMDLVLTSAFATHEGLEIYRTHPAHVAVVEFIKTVTEFSKVVDYER